MLVSAYKSRIQGKFEGGNSLSLDWYTNAEEASESMLTQINPESLKRVVPIYGGLTANASVYHCPADVHAPSDLYNNTNRDEKWTYMPSKAFHQSTDDYTYTIETINGVKFLVIRNALASSTLEVDSFDSVGSKTGVSLETNAFNFLSGSGALQGTFTDVLTDVEETLSEALDITDYKRGVALLGVNLQDARKLASIQIILTTSSGNYYTLTSTADSIGDHIKDGWNSIRFEMQNAVETGTPVDTNITAYTVSATMNSGESQTVIIDRLSLEKTVSYNFEYYSSYMFIDGTTGSWKSAPESESDIINVDGDEKGIMVFEGCRLVGFGSKKKKNVPPFDEELIRKYNAHWSDHPSSVEPLSYSGSPNISKSLNI